MNSDTLIVTSAASRGTPRPVRSAGNSNGSLGEQKDTYMFRSKAIKANGLFFAAAVGGVLALGSVSANATTVLLPSPMVDYMAANYNPATGVWTDSSGNGDNATQTPGSSAPTLALNATPNGSAAVAFNGSQSLNITTGLTSSTGYTVLAYLYPTTESSTNVILGIAPNANSGGALEYRLNGGKQDVLEATTADLGTSTTVLPVSSWSNINVAVDSSGGTFRYNGSSDGTSSGWSSSEPTTVIAASSFDGNFIGNIAAIQVYSGVLSTTQRQAVEQQFTNAYVTPVPEPAPLSLLAVGGLGLLLIGRKRAASRSA